MEPVRGSSQSGGSGGSVLPVAAPSLLRPVVASTSSGSEHNALVSTSSKLLTMSYADPNRVNTDFKPGEIWSLSKDGSTGLDAKGRKKMWNKLKKEVIHRETPEDLEHKADEEEKKRLNEYRESEDYKERVALDLAQATLAIKDRASELGLTPGRLRDELLNDDDEVEESVEEDEAPDNDIAPTRHEMFLAKVASAQRVLAQLRPGAANTVLASEPKGLGLDLRELADKNIEDILLKYPIETFTIEKQDDDTSLSIASKRSGSDDKERRSHRIDSDDDRDYRKRRRHRHKASRSRKRYRRDDSSSAGGHSDKDDDERYHRGRDRSRHHRRRRRRGSDYY